MTATAYRARFAIVEDEPFMAQLVSFMLVSSGAEVEVFELGAEFLKSADLLKFKAVILDLALPDLDGFGVMKDLATNTIGNGYIHFDDLQWTNYLSRFYRLDMP